MQKEIAYLSYDYIFLGKTYNVPFHFPVYKTVFLMGMDSAIQEGVCKCPQNSSLLGNVDKDQENTYSYHSVHAQLKAAQNRALNGGQKL